MPSGAVVLFYWDVNPCSCYTNTVFYYIAFHEMRTKEISCFSSLIIWAITYNDLSSKAITPLRFFSNISNFPQDFVGIWNVSIA